MQLGKSHCLPVVCAGKMEDEMNPKKLPKVRKVNFSPLEESILQREVEKNFDVLKEKHSNAMTNVEKARIWSEITTKINASNYMSVINKKKCLLKNSVLPVS
jgi:hypothetical protein